MQLFYNPNISSNSTEVTFDKEESRHITKVLRKVEGDILNLTNGKGYFFEAKLLSINPKRCTATLIKSEKQDPLPYSLHLAVAPTKSNDRYEWFLEKATEIGITEITPIICDHSERKFIKKGRYEKIVQSAMKQSLKAYLPRLNPAVSFKKFITSNPNGDMKLIAHCCESEKQSLKLAIGSEKSILILIGPEGDFSKEEVLMSKNYGLTAISLGNSRLRTETAALVSCHFMYFIVNN